GLAAFESFTDSLLVRTSWSAQSDSLLWLPNGFLFLSLWCLHGLRVPPDRFTHGLARFGRNGVGARRVVEDFFLRLEGVECGIDTRRRTGCVNESDRQNSRRFGARREVHRVVVTRGFEHFRI